MTDLDNGARTTPANATTPARPKRRWARVVSIGLGVFVLLMAAIYSALTIAFPPERIAALLASQVKEATGRDFRIDGGLSFHVVPTIAVHAGDVVLGNADWGSRPDMVRIRSASFEISPRALLAGELRILRVDVSGVDALLEADDAGRANWQFAPRTAVAPVPASAADNARATSFELDRLVASDVRVAYRPGGKAKPHTLAIESFDLRAKGERDQIVMTFAVGQQRWKVEGLIGRSTLLLAGEEDWPFDLQIGDQALVLQCAVVRLPLRQGVAAVDRSIALETREVAIVASGTVNLVEQTLRLEFASTVKKGLGLNPANFSELVMVSGPLQDPQVGVDMKGAARGAANVGVAVATGGLSLLAPIVAGGAKDAPPCGQAAAAAPAKQAPTEKKRGFLGIR